jgi:hypothetical protein
MEGRLTITVEAYGAKYSIETNDETDINDMVMILKKLLVCIGFNHDNINEVFNGEEI